MRWFVGLCAGAVLALSVWTIGCGGTYQAPPETGGGKGPDMKSTVSSGRLIPAGASSMAPTPPGLLVAPPSAAVDAGETADAGTDQ
jgi:hypothetical protein